MIQRALSAWRPAGSPSRCTSPGIRVIAVILCVVLPTSARCFGQQRTRLINQESALADLHYGQGTVALVMSADGSRSVSVLCDGKAFSIDDGYPGFFYDELAPGMPLLSANGRHCAYVGRREITVSNCWFVVFDGAESIPFPYVNMDSPVFNRDGSRLAVVVEGSDGNYVRVFSAPPASPAPAPVPATQPATRAIDSSTEWWRARAKDPLVPLKPQGDLPKLESEPGPLFDDISTSSLRFSPDGRHLAYAARHDKSWRVILDGNDSGGVYDAVGRPGFCGSGALLGYVARREGKSVVVTVPVGVAGAVGSEGQPLDSIDKDSLTLSFDGRHLAYAAGKPGAMSVYLDGVEIRPVAGLPAVAAPFDRVAAGSFVFCPDGSRFAFAASRDGQWFVVLDGVEGRHYIGISQTRPVFSLNGKRLAYVAEVLVADADGRPAHTKRCVVVDGVQQRIYDRIVASPGFSSDGRRCAYVAERGRDSFIVVDGMEGKPYGCLRGRPVLSIDGSRCAITAVADDPDNRFHAVEEVPRDPSDPSAGARLIFDRSAYFGALSPAQQTNPVKLLLVEERVGPE